MVLFVVSYARTDPVRHTRSGGAVLGSVRRGATERRVLAEGHRATLVLELQGYLFFGSMHRVTERIEERLAISPALARLVLDFRHVSGIDATATAALANVARTSGAHGVAVSLSAVPSAARSRVARALAAAGSAGAVAFAASLADATDGCDAEVLGGALAAPDAVGAALDRLEQLVGDDLEPMDLLPHLERVRLPPGATVLAAGAVPDALWLVAAGRLGATGTRTPDGGPTERLSPGALVGAAELLSGRPAEASMVALEATTLYRLGREALARIDAHDPALAGAVHAAVARQLADELDHLRAFTASVEDRGPTTVSSATVPARGPG